MIKNNNIFYVRHVYSLIEDACITIYKRNTKLSPMLYRYVSSSFLKNSNYPVMRMIFKDFVVEYSCELDILNLISKI